MTTVRLAFMRPTWEMVLYGCLPALLTVIVLSETGTAGPRTAMLIAAGIVVIAGATPHTYWLRADANGLTMTRLLVRRTYPWPAVHGLRMRFREDGEVGGRYVTLQLRLTDPPGLHWGPFLGKLTVSDGDLPRGTEPRALADLFALFGTYGLHVDHPEFANAVLAAHRLPPLPPQPVRRVPTGPVPTPQQAYADAPSIEDERRHLRHRPSFPRKLREYLLRCAAMSDRVALQTDDTVSADVVRALREADQLAEHDQVVADDDRRGYVRQQYLIWRNSRP
ncbi:PH domain-containing protein [Streptomyces camelliae]|uniref:PH domain-containing protein n=1 Tax=Streptomyces camelliae TaxID=3004093 RepID=A0ABY7PGH4_9ACTN|nr:PH domain-containing protein [Streptomyces sp. HUAS 2-6]WBO68672.1 PH domain-containing protein [Streptomyces sp. HUAS 2-6]